MLRVDRWAAEQEQETYLPRPPDDSEKYKYLVKQPRWVFVWLLVASFGVLYGYVRVAERAWLVSPLMWLLLMVIVPPIVVNFWLRIGPPRLTLAEHQATVASYCEHGETVDVFLPSCGEPLAVLNNTFKYVSKMSWQGVKNIYVLDDSAREAVRDLAGTYNFRYIVRPDPGAMKKAGNGTVHRCN
jgi:cellulose synthase (UDP-forming)